MNQSSNFLSIEEFNDLFQQWSGDTIKISKLEINDHDEIMMQLNQILYENEVPTIDGYEPIHTLQLSGTGTIQTENNMSQPLPSPMYEIPLENDSLYEFDGETFIISTDRGVYKIERVQSY